LQVKSKKLSKNNLVDTLIFYFKSFHLLHYIERKIFFELSLRLFFLQKKRITAIKRFRLASPTQIARLKPRNFDYLQNVNLKSSSQRQENRISCVYHHQLILTHFSLNWLVINQNSQDFRKCCVENSRIRK